MSDITTTDQVLKTGVGAIAGAVIATAAVPFLAPIIGATAVGAAALAGAGTIGTVVGTLWGWKWGEPTPEKLALAIQKHAYAMKQLSSGGLA